MIPTLHLRRNILRLSLARTGLLKILIGQSRFNSLNHGQPENLELYPGHIRLSPSQRIALSVGSAFMALFDPYRDDMVATFGEATGQTALIGMHAKMCQNCEGARILQLRPRINSTTVDIDKLGQLPSNTFGHCYYRFLIDNKVSPDTRKEVRFVDDADLAYVMQRYREVHDLVHALLAMPTNMLGEVLVKWVEAIQTGLPLCFYGGLFGATRLNGKGKQFYLNGGLQWALQCGHEADSLLSVFYEQRWEQDLEDLRRELKIPPPPPIPTYRTRK